MCLGRTDREILWSKEGDGVVWGEWSLGIYRSFI